jgi:hypothetical protein
MEGMEDSGGSSKISLESSVLGIIAWWLKKHTRAEVLMLINRHYRPEEVFLANEMLAQACKLQDQISHRNSPLSWGSQCCGSSQQYGNA